MAQRPQRRLRRGEETLRPGRTRRQPEARRRKHHEYIPAVHTLGRSPSHQGQHGLGELLRRRHVPETGSGGSVCDLRVGSVLWGGCDGFCAGDGGEGVMGGAIYWMIE